MAIHIEPLQKQHDRRAFSCGQPSLDDWFRNRASQDSKHDLAQVFVAVDDELGLVSFYSLSAFALRLDELPKDLASKLPRYAAIPAALIGRLVRDLRSRGQRMGDILLADAIKSVLAARESLGIYVIVVDALNEIARDFYVSSGFTTLPTRPDRLFFSRLSPRRLVGETTTILLGKCFQLAAQAFRLPRVLKRSGTAPSVAGRRGLDPWSSDRVMKRR